LANAHRVWSTGVRHFSTDHSDGQEAYRRAISEENILKCIERMKRIRLGGGGGKNMPNRASVLVPFCFDPRSGKPAILFTQRSFSLQKHKGEICFPGGFEEAGDRDVIDSAVRELIEE